MERFTLPISPKQNGDDFDVCDDIAEINIVGTVKNNKTKQVKYHSKSIVVEFNHDGF